MAKQFTHCVVIHYYLDTYNGLVRGVHNDFLMYWGLSSASGNYHDYLIELGAAL